MAIGAKDTGRNENPPASFRRRRAGLPRGLRRPPARARAAARLYRLTNPDDFPAAARVAPVQLVVDVPTAQAALGTARIALTRSPTTFDYFADSAWTDRLPALVQALLVEALEDLHRIAAVGPDDGALRADVVLATELRHFEAVYDGGAGPPRWRIEIAAKLVKMPDRTILAGREFGDAAAAERNDMPAILAAGDAAWRDAARHIAEWAADALAATAR